MNNYFLKTLFFVFLCRMLPLLALDQTTIEFRTAAFFHSSERFRDLYGNVGPNYQIEARTTFCSCTCFETWVNLDYFSKKNKIEHCCDGKTKVDISTISLGINYVFETCYCFDAYIGLGPTFAKVDLKNKSCCLREKETKYPFGGILKAGIRYYFCNDFFLDVFVDYLYQPINYHHHVDMGGLKTGAGIGWRF